VLTSQKQQCLFYLTLNLRHALKAVRTVTMTLLKILSQPFNDLHGQISSQECRSIINLCINLRRTILSLSLCEHTITTLGIDHFKKNCRSFFFPHHRLFSLPLLSFSITTNDPDPFHQNSCNPTTSTAAKSNQCFQKMTYRKHFVIKGGAGVLAISNYHQQTKSNQHLKSLTPSSNTPPPLSTIKISSINLLKALKITHTQQNINLRKH